MKRVLHSVTCSLAILLLSQPVVFANDSNMGGITIHNASHNTISAELNSYGRVDIEANGEKNVSYTTLQQACSPTPTRCRADFYINDKPAGSATIDTVSGKLLSMNTVQLKVKTESSENVLRTVVIE